LLSARHLLGIPTSRRRHHLRVERHTKTRRPLAGGGTQDDVIARGRTDNQDNIKAQCLLQPTGRAHFPSSSGMALPVLFLSTSIGRLCPDLLKGSCCLRTRAAEASRAERVRCQHKTRLQRFHRHLPSQVSARRLLSLFSAGQQHLHRHHHLWVDLQQSLPYLPAGAAAATLSTWASTRSLQTESKNAWKREVKH
jgi:hypothetical protein